VIKSILLSAKREKTTSSGVFSVRSRRTVSRSRAIFVTRGSYISNVPRITASWFSDGRLRAIPDVRLEISERESANMSGNRKRLEKKTRSFSFFPPFLCFFFFLSFTVFPSIFISIYIRGIDRRRLCCRARRCFFIPFYVAIHSCVLRSCPRSDQTHK